MIFLKIFVLSKTNILLFKILKLTCSSPSTTPLMLFITPPLIVIVPPVSRNTIGIFILPIEVIFPKLRMFNEFFCASSKRVKALIEPSADISILPSLDIKL